MPATSFLVLSGVYDRVEDALDDYDAVKTFHRDGGMIAGFDAAVVERRSDGEVKIRKHHETPTRVGGVGGGTLGLATGLVIALFPAAAIGGGLLLATTGTGAVLGAVAGHAVAGMSRKDLKEIGEQLDEGQAGLVVVGPIDLKGEFGEAMSHARKVESREITADTEKLEADSKEAAGSGSR